MLASITREKSFEPVQPLSNFEKEIGPSDLQEFFDKEGEYMDRLAAILKEHGNQGDSFTLYYTITITV